MTTDTRMRQIWKRLEAALDAQLPAARANLRPGAAASALRQLERRTGIGLPAAFRASLGCHDGERNPNRPNVLPEGHRLLPAAAIGKHWAMLRKLFREEKPGELWEWADAVRDGVWFVHGAVKPLNFSQQWLPFADMDGKSTLYLDFDPAPGGRAGQVIGVSLHGATWEVLAPSYEEYLRAHLRLLERRRYRIEAGSLVLPARRRGRRTLPRYLRGARRPRAPRISAKAEPGDREVRGRMTWVQGGDLDMIWVRIKPRGRREVSVPLARSFTRGFAQARMGDHAAIVLRRHRGEYERYRYALDESKVTHIGVAYRRLDR